jgi:pimeloyl-ACP methyl ester carboxylesterase
VRAQELRFESGGKQCAAWFFQPAEPVKDTQAPCVVLGTGASCVYDQGLALYAERFANAGFAALAFDYRYFGRSGGEPRGLMLAGRQRDDWRAAVRCARSLDAVDPGRIVLWGYSLGGGHVQSLALTEPGIAAAVCVAPVVDGLRSLLHIGGVRHVLRLAGAGLRDSARALRGAEPFRIAATGPPGSLGLLTSPDSQPGFKAMTTADSSWRNALCARAALAPPYRLVRKTRGIACPILYCVTEDDDVNPPALGKRAVGPAPRGELRLYPGGHYDPFQGKTFERMVADQLDFLHRRTASSAPARSAAATANRTPRSHLYWRQQTD